MSLDVPTATIRPAERRLVFEPRSKRGVSPSPSAFDITGPDAYNSTIMSDQPGKPKLTKRPHHRAASPMDFGTFSPSVDPETRILSQRSRGLGPFLVVGCGSIGRRHVRNLVAGGNSEVAVCDPDPERTGPVIEEAGLLRPAYADYNEALSSVKPNIIFICTPPPLHLKQALAAVRVGAHVFIEKPLSNRLDGVDELLHAATDRKRICQVGYNLRFHVGIRKVKELLHSDAIGHVSYAQVVMGQYLPDWRPWQDYRQSYTARSDMGGGIILDASHELDYALWLLGRPASAFCSADRISGLDVDVEDSATILLRYTSGARCDIHLDFVRRDYARGCSLCGESGTIVWDYVAQQVRLYRAADRAWETFSCECDPNDMYRAELEHFLDCVQTQTDPLVGLEQGRTVLALIETARRSAETGTWEVTTWQS